MSARTLLYLQLLASDVAAELWVNDLPVAHVKPARDGSVSLIPAEPFLRPGRSTFSLVLAPGATPSVSRVPYSDTTTAGGEALFRLIRVEEGTVATAEAGQPLLQIDPDATTKKVGLPLTLTSAVDVPEASERWVWTNLPPLVDGPEVHAEARALLDQLAAAIAKKDGAALAALFEIRMRELARAFRFDDASLREDLEQWIGNLSPEDPVVRDDGQADYRIVGDGCVLECIDRDFTPSLKTRDKEGNVTGRRLLLGRVNGALAFIK